MSKILECDFRSCVHNNACCHIGIFRDQNKCTCDEGVVFKKDIETGTFICSKFMVDTNKKRVCPECEIMQNGYIKVNTRRRTRFRRLHELERLSKPY